MTTSKALPGWRYFITLMVLSIKTVLLAASEQPTLNNKELVMLGKQIYRQGLSSTNRPVTAIVQGDVPLKGTQFTCISCHRRSGMGAIEGDRIVPLVTGPALYHSSDWLQNNIKDMTNNALTFSNSNQSRISTQLTYKKNRPAYTDQTLARAIRNGIDSNGRSFDPLMPRYDLTEQDSLALITYLKTLSSQFSPGVTQKDIYLATVITEEVNAKQLQAMFAVLETYFQEKNAQTRNEIERLQKGPFYHHYKNQAYRQWVLLPWLLTGTPETWTEQLIRYNQQQPVFAIISGISTYPWQSIHTFCEQQQIPCLLPNTAWPTLVNESDDFYTFYFSKGISLEALILAKQLAKQSTAAIILQVFRPDSLGAVAAQLFHRTLPKVAIHDWSLTSKLTVNSLRHQLSITQANRVIFWLTGDELIELKNWSEPLEDSLQFYFSATLLNSQFTLIPEVMRNKSFVAHPYSLPTDLKQRSQRIQAWLRNRNLPLVDIKIQDQTYFASLIMGEALTHIKRYFYRDYLIDTIDHAEGMGIFSAYYPRLSFGPGQRYLAKGGYILELTSQNDELVNNNTWIVP
jgi:hypothetical protein